MVRLVAAGIGYVMLLSSCSCRLSLDVRIAAFAEATEFIDIHWIFGMIPSLPSGGLSTAIYRVSSRSGMVGLIPFHPALHHMMWGAD